MRCDILTLFPEAVNTFLEFSILKRAKDKGVLEVKVYNIRDFTEDRHRMVDDHPYGGGAGMVMKPEPLFKALEYIKSDNEERWVILMSPQGRQFNHEIARRLSEEKRRLVFICGRYEGIDERVRTALVDEELSIGDYVLTGGELSALVVIDSSIRFIPGVLGNERSALEDSFSQGILDYPHYTRPADFRGMKVPEVLLSGDHEKIRRWRKKSAISRTLRQRPDLIEKMKPTEEDLKIINEIKKEEGL